MTLHADATRTLAAWTAPDAGQERLRVAYLAHLAAHPEVMWLQTGGHCEADDASLVDAAAREALEETGIAGLQVDPDPLRLSRHAVPFCSPGGHHLDVQLLAVAPVDAEPVVAEDEDPVAWFGVDDPVEPTDADTLALIAAARTRLRGTPRP